MNTWLVIYHGFAAFYDRHSGVLNLLGLSFVVTMPKGKAVIYEWLRTGLQTFVGTLKPHPPEQPQSVAAPDPTVAHP